MKKLFLIPVLLLTLGGCETLKMQPADTFNKVKLHAWNTNGQIARIGTIAFDHGKIDTTGVRFVLKATDGVAAVITAADSVSTKDLDTANGIIEAVETVIQQVRDYLNKNGVAI